VVAHDLGDARLTALLLRPDGVIAWADDDAGLHQAIDAWF